MHLLRQLNNGDEHVSSEIGGLVCEPDLETLLIKQEVCHSDKENEQPSDNNFSSIPLPHVKEEMIDYMLNQDNEESSQNDSHQLRISPEFVSFSFPHIKEEAFEDSAPTIDTNHNPTKVLPIPGGWLTPIPPGTKVSSSNVTKTSTSRTGLPAGVYKFNSLIDGLQSVMIIKQDGAAASPTHAFFKFFFETITLYFNIPGIQCYLFCTGPLDHIIYC